MKKYFLQWYCLDCRKEDDEFEIPATQARQYHGQSYRITTVLCSRCGAPMARRLASDQWRKRIKGVMMLCDVFLFVKPNTPLVKGVVTWHKQMRDRKS